MGKNFCRPRMSRRGWVMAGSARLQSRSWDVDTKKDAPLEWRAPGGSCFLRLVVVQEAAGELAGCHRLEPGYGLRAARPDVGAARMERAAGRSVERMGQGARDHRQRH